jgi:hypothetical protein
MNIFDPHVSGSLSVSGSGEISGDLTVLGTLFATISGTTQNAVSTSHAANYTLTSSFGAFTSSYTTGSFTGSFNGDGSKLYNIPASGVTGLNLTRIADGSATASISSANGLRINTNTEITGTLKVNNFNLGGDDIVEITLTDAGGKYYVNGVKNPKLSFIRGFKYRFYFDNNNVHPLLFSLTNDGEHNGGVVYTTGVTTGATPFYVQIHVTDATPSTLYYFCDFHVGMGNAISVYSDFLNAQSSVNLTNVDTGMFATTGSNNFTNIQRTSGSLVVTGSVDVSGSHNVTGSVNITGSITLNGQAIGTGKLDETTFQTYTSSNDGRLFAIENSTSSYNTFTNSIDTRIKNEMNEENVISGSIQVLITGTTGFSTFSSSVSTSIDALSSSVATTTSGITLSIGSLSSSVATTTSGLSSSIGAFSSSIATTTSGLSSSIGLLSSSVATTTSDLSSSIGALSSSFSSTNDTQNNKLSSIESTTSSLNTFSSSIDTTIKNKLNTDTVISGSIQVLITGTTGYSTFSSSISTSISELSSSVSTSIDSLSSSVATTTSGLSSSIGTISSSFSSTNGTQNSRLNSIETSTGSLNSFTESINTTIKNKLNADSVISGSSQILITGTTGYSTFSSSISTSIGELSSSVATTTNTLSSSVATTTSGLTSTITSLSSSIATTTNTLSSSVATTTSGLTLSISSLSSSVATTTGDLSSSIGGLSSSVATINLNQNNRLDSIEGKTGSYATTGSNVFKGDQTITGSLYISQNLIVQGSSSLENITASAVSIGTNTIVLNTDSPAFRYAGISVFDSGSTNITASLFYDSLTNQWKFKHTDTGTNDASIMLFGPLGNDIDNAQLLDGNYLTKVENNGHGHHLTTSSIFDNGSKVSINSNTEVTGTLKVTGNISSPNITAIETSTGSLNTFTSSLLTAIELTGSNLTVRGNLLVKGTTTNVNTTTLDVDNNLINLNGTGATSAGLRVKDTTGPNQVSGSLLWDATNDYWIGGPLGSEQRLVRETEFNTQVTRINNVETSTASLNSFTSSINTTIKNRLNTEGVISGSVQVNHNATTNYDANQHVDHTSVSVSAGNGLSGGGTIAANRELRLDTGSVHFLDGVKKELNTEGVISGSSQILLNSTVHSGSFFAGVPVVSGSAQVSFNGITDKPALVSGSSQISYPSLSNIPGGIVSGSAQISFNGIVDKPALVSGSSQISYPSLSNIPSGIVSGSGQLTTFVLKAGDTMTGQLVIGSTGTAGAATLKINTSTATSFIHSQENFSANMTAGQTNILVVGQAGSTKNAGYLGYNWSSSASNSNYVSLGHWGADNLLRVYGDGTVFMGTVTTGVWNGTAIGDTYISSASNWNTAFNKRISSLGFTSSTVTITLADSATVTASVPTFNQNTTGTAANITASSNTSLTSLANLATVGTITSGVWNGTAIANANLANSSFNIGTTSISLGRSSASQTLTGVSIDGNAATATEVIRTVSASSEANLVYATIADNDFFRIRVGGGSNSGFAEIATADDATEPIHVRQYSGTFATLTRTATLLDGSGNTSFPGTVTAPTFSGALSGNASTVTNGVYTNGSYSDPSWITLLAGSKISGAVASATNATAAANISLTSLGNGSVNVNNGSSAVYRNENGSGAALSYSPVFHAGAGDTMWQIQGTYGTSGNGTFYFRQGYSGSWGNWLTMLSSANYNSYSPTLTGGNASGTWGISITGNAATATSADQIDNVSFVNSNINNALNANSIDSNVVGYVTNVDGSTTNLTGNATDGAIYGQAYSSNWQHQIYGDYRTGIMYVRGKNNNTWQSWKRVALSSSTTFSNVSSLTFTHTLGTANVTAQVFDTNGDMFWPSNIRITATQVILTFASNRSGRLVVTG